MAHYIVQSSVPTDTNDGISWHGTDENYSIRRTSGAWSSPYKQLKIEWQTGIIVKPGDGYTTAMMHVHGGVAIGSSISPTVNINSAAPQGLLVEGKVGIGTVAPSKKLEVFTGTSGDGLRLTYDAATDYVNGILLRGDTLDICANTTATGAGGDIRFNVGSETATKMIVNVAGNVGIGDDAPSYKLEVAGTFYSSGSSIEYKEDVEPYTPPEGALMGLKPVQYQYKDAWKDFGKRYSGNSSRQIGFVAEDVAKILPELAVTKSENGEEVVRNVDYEKLTVLLVSEVQNLRREVNDLRRDRENNSRPSSTNTKSPDATTPSRRLQASISRHG